MFKICDQRAKVEYLSVFCLNNTCPKILLKILQQDFYLSTDFANAVHI